MGCCSSNEQSVQNSSSKISKRKVSADLQSVEVGDEQQQEDQITSNPHHICAEETRQVDDDDETKKIVVHETAEPSPLAVNPLSGAPDNDDDEDGAANEHDKNQPISSQLIIENDNSENKSETNSKTPLESEDSSDDDDAGENQKKLKDPYWPIAKTDSGDDDPSKKNNTIDQDGKPLPKNLVIGSYHSLQLRTKFENKFEAVAIGNQIFVSELNPSSISPPVSLEHSGVLPQNTNNSAQSPSRQNSSTLLPKQQQNNNNNASSTSVINNVAINETNRVTLRPIGFLGDESLETMKSRSCSTLCFSHDSTLICTATREGRISIWSTITGEESQAFGWSASLANFGGSTTSISAASHRNNNNARRRRSTIQRAAAAAVFAAGGDNSSDQNQFQDEFLLGLAAGNGDTCGNDEIRGGFLGGHGNPNDIATSDVFKGVELQLCLSTPSAVDVLENNHEGNDNNNNNNNNSSANNNGSGHEKQKYSSIHSIAWSHNDRNIFCGLADGTIQIWDVDSCALREDAPVIYNGHSSWVVSLATNNVHLQDFESRAHFPKNVQLLLASSSIDETICIFDVTALDLRSSKKEISLLRKIENGHAGSVNCVIFANDIRIYYDNDELISNNDEDDFNDVEERDDDSANNNNHDDMFSHPVTATSGDNKKKKRRSTKRKYKHYIHVISASADKTIKCWDVRTGKQRGLTISSGESGAHSDSVTSIALSTPDGKSLVSVAQDRTLCRFDVYDFFFQELLFPPEDLICDNKNNGDGKDDSAQQSKTSAFEEETFGVTIEVNSSTTDAIMGAYVETSAPRENQHQQQRKPSSLMMLMGNSNNQSNLSAIQNFNNTSHYTSSMMLFSKENSAHHSYHRNNTAATDRTASWGRSRDDYNYDNNNNTHSMKVDRLRTGHRDNITGVCFVPETNVAVTCSLDELLKVWNTDKDSNHSTNFGLVGGSTSSATAVAGGFQQQQNNNINNISATNLKETSTKKEGSTVSTVVHRDSSTLSSINHNHNNNNNHNLLSSNINSFQNHLQPSHANTLLGSSAASNNMLLSSSGTRLKSGSNGFNAASAQSLLSSVTSQKNLKTLLADVQVKSRIYAVAATNDGCVLACGRMDGRTPLFAVCKGTPLSRRPLELEEKIVSMGFTDDGSELVATDLQGDTTRFLLSTIRM